MTDKQIIIDGVDVSGCHNRTFYKNDEGDVQCKCYRFEDADSDTLLFGICKQHPHCYYKQLKRKEQECEELKKELHKNFEEKDTLHLIIDRLLEASGYDTNTASAEEFEDVYEHMRYEQQQLDQLKAENEELKIYIESNKQQIKEVEMLVMDNDRLINELTQYKQTITEIKEIAEKRNYLDYNECLDEILQKISECEENDA